MQSKFLGFLCVLLFAGCKEEIKKNVPLVNFIVTPAENNSSLPFLFSDGEKMLMSWIEKKNDSLTVLKYGVFMDEKWQNPREIVSGHDWFINWADFPAIAETNGNVISHVLKKSSAGAYSYDVKLNFLPTGETNWLNDIPLHSDGTPTEHGFVTLLPYKDGFFVTWLDGRNTIEDESGDRGAMTIRAAEISVKGVILNEVELDSRVCDCCQTTAAITPKGPVVIYRDRSEDEIRDMSIVRRVNGQWTTPQTVYADDWKIKGCPVNGPEADAFKNTLAMAWFTAAEEMPKVQLIFSGDEGATFDNSITVAETNVMGRVDVLLLDEQRAIVSWMESKNGIAQFKAVKINRDGNKGNDLVVSEMDASRKSGFPQMERVGEKIYFAWTDDTHKETKVQTAYIDLEHF